MQQPNGPEPILRNRQPERPPGTTTRTGQKQPSRFPEKDANWLREKKRVRITHIGLLLIVVLVFSVILLVYNASLNRMQAELDDARALLLESQQELAKKERELRFSSTDAYVEQEARKRFGYIREDEIRFVPDPSITNPYGYGN